MTLKAFPGATWVGSKLSGKPWVGVTKPIVVLHTLEFNSWPDPDRWDAPAHLVCNPNTGEVHQYLPMDKAAYSVRDNALEDDFPTWQVELWGRAAEVPNYSDEWYQGLAGLLDVFITEYGIPVEFADFSRVAVAYPGATPDRMTDVDVRAFSGFLGHCHMGLGVDTHWDPGRLDVERVLSFMEADVFTHFEIGSEYAEYEPVTWMLYILKGGVVDPNEHSSQVTSVLNKTNVRLVTEEDLDLIADFTNMDSYHRDLLKESGLYRFGKEVATLRQYAYIDR